ncbi:hypothetical protein FRC01_002039 [Tulasnella sp. 417]|nr:hypothetical protein FRC01_002039 [Tulasnella sp. 417]
MATLQDTLANALKNKTVIQNHMRQHQKCWEAPPELDSNASSHTIQVFVRVRPLLQRDIDSGAFSLVMVQPPRTVHFTHPTNRRTGGCFATKTYDADGVFDEETTNDTVYERLQLQGMVKQALSEPGHEFCVMAYGQTGTGKTYTTTAIEERLTAEVFSLMPDESTPKLSLTAFEIRGGKPYDLLSEPSHNPAQITSANGSSTYPGLGKHSFSTQEDLVTLLAKAKELRMTRSTVKNDTNSRSHCIVTLYVEHAAGGGPDIIIVDLAERPRKSQVRHDQSTATTNWPALGEIDIIEGVNDQSPNHSTLHTTSGCTMSASNMVQTGSLATTDCYWQVNGNSGCGVAVNKPNNYGAAFNANGGGWYATERTAHAINLWFWPRNDATVPNDVKNGASSVNTANWGTPYANFVDNTCNFQTHFGDENLIINLTLYHVNQDPADFKNAYWDIASLRVYQ